MRTALVQTSTPEDSRQPERQNNDDLGVMLRRGVVLMLLGIAAFVLVTLIGYLILVSARQLTLQANQGRWANNGSWNYRATVRMGGGSAGVAENKLIVRMGRVVSQTGFHCIQECDESAFRSFSTSVEGLFDTVAECNRWLFSCAVEYDGYYGYPSVIDHQCYGECKVAYVLVMHMKVEPADIGS
jgi:hypothetical protein